MIHPLPEDSTLEGIQYHLYVLEKIRKGRKPIKNGWSLGMPGNTLSSPGGAA
jgi:hypothetical protein